MLGIHAIGNRHREAESSSRQVRVAILLVVYVLTFLQFNLRDLSNFHAIELAVLEELRSGEVAPEDAADAYRDSLAERLPEFSGREGLDPWKTPLPWE